MTKKMMSATSKLTILAKPLDKPRFSNRRLGDVKSMANKQENENGISTC